VQVHPGLFAAGAPWLTGPAYKDTLAHYSNTAVPCTYVRDKGEGWVTIDKQGYPRVHYQISPFDQKSLWKVITCFLILNAVFVLCNFGAKTYELQIELQFCKLQLAAKHVVASQVIVQDHAILENAFPACCLVFCTFLKATCHVSQTFINAIRYNRLQRACSTWFGYPVMSHMVYVPYSSLLDGHAGAGN
jgi:hypothetical protein